MDLHSCEAAETIAKSVLVRLAQVIQIVVCCATLVLTIRILMQAKYRNITLHVNLKVASRRLLHSNTLLADAAEPTPVLLLASDCFDCQSRLVPGALSPQKIAQSAAYRRFILLTAIHVVCLSLFGSLSPTEGCVTSIRRRSLCGMSQ